MASHPPQPGPRISGEPIAPRDDVWSDLARFALRLCEADHAGAGPARDHPGIDRLAAQLSDGGEVAMIRDAARRTHLAGAALGRDPAAGLVWVERRMRFDRAALARLRWLAAGGLELLRALDAEHAQAELLLRENRHRSANDLHLVSSLLSHQARFAEHPGVGAALENVAARVMTLARARQMPHGDLASGIRACAAALAAHVDARGIAIDVRIEGDCPPIDERRGAVLLIAVNELATNAIKHAFAGRSGGRVTITLASAPDRVRIAVEDNGRAFAVRGHDGRTGSGLDLVQRLVGGVRGTYAAPVPGSKCFTIEMPVAAATQNRRDR